MKSYTIRELFYSLQGEGVRAGTANVFVRFSGCNLDCRWDGPAGFDCDTDFTGGARYTLAELLKAMAAAWREGCGGGVAGAPPAPRSCVLTGGEPGLQLDQPLVDALQRGGWYIAVETNGTRPLPEGLDWVCVSPKTPEAQLVLEVANEVKYVRREGQPLPTPRIHADHYLLSPAFAVVVVDGKRWPRNRTEPGALPWCIELVRRNPRWRLSLQQHKMWGVR